MLRRIADRNIWVIYATIVLLGIAYGTSIAVLAVHLDAHGIIDGAVKDQIAFLQRLFGHMALRARR